ncbi:peptidylprolyl isomerase [Paenibacillus sp. EZ-K15]|uniref:peptidylprolyl isomerase n=1 Tax=Paenibacillus sp. EZ-K15 TaxID=2044275 RepID=UPI000BF408C3|nr:peptidylprolyl isomerase [Paenibacillus sp. EZ-K15]
MFGKRPIARTFILLLVSLVVATAIIAVALNMEMRASADEVVLTIDDEPVTVQEFQFFLQQNKAWTTSYFKQKYNADYSEDFWTSAYEGETPLDYARQKTVQDVARIKTEQSLMKQHGIIQDVSYASFLRNLAAENETRQQKIREGQPIYGPQQYGAEPFYSYTQSMNYQRLIDTLVKQTRSSLGDKELKALYEEVKPEYFHLGYAFVYEKVTASGTESSRTLNTLQELVLSKKLSVEEAIARLSPSGLKVQKDTLDIDTKSKDDDAARYLHDVLTSTQPGEFTAIQQDAEGSMMIRLLDTRDKGYAPYEQVKTSLVQLYIQKQLEQQVSQKLHDANIRINEEVLRSISF